MEVKTNINSQFLGLQMTVSEGSLGSLWPVLLRAITRNSYSCPSVRSGTVAYKNHNWNLLIYQTFRSLRQKILYLETILTLFCFPGTWQAFCQNGLPFSFFWIMYPVIGEPPSDLGTGHSRSTWSLSQSVIRGLPGQSGSSKIEVTKKIN